MAISLTLVDGVWADQAAYLEREAVVEAGNRIDLDQQILFYCQPCDDGEAESVVVTQIGVHYTGFEDYFELRLNDRGVDLAYTYVSDGDRWQNLALLLGLEVVDVPQFLTPDLEIMSSVLEPGPQEHGR